MDKQKCRKELGLPDEGLFIGTAGALGSSRGIETLFEAHQKIVRATPDVHLVLAGTVESGTTLPKGRKTHYLGSLEYSEIPKVLNTLDVGVICNLDSPFGRYCFPQKAYEMLACNIPVVAADTGGAKEIFAATPSSLYQPGDSNDLADMVQKQLRQASVPTIAACDWRNRAQEIDDLMEEVVAKRKDS